MLKRLVRIRTHPPPHSRYSENTEYVTNKLLHLCVRMRIQTATYEYEYAVSVCLLHESTWRSWVSLRHVLRCCCSASDGIIISINILDDYSHHRHLHHF